MNLAGLSKYSQSSLIWMAIAMAILFTLEMLGVFTDKHVTITAIVRATVPKWARAMILGWMVYHFMFGD